MPHGMPSEQFAEPKREQPDIAEMVNKVVESYMVQHKDGKPHSNYVYSVASFLMKCFLKLQSLITFALCSVFYTLYDIFWPLISKVFSIFKDQGTSGY